MKRIIFLILWLIISFIKSLRTTNINIHYIIFLFIIHGYRPIAIALPSKRISQRISGQSVLEYSLLLVVIAGIMLGFFANGFQPLKDIFNSTHNKMMERIVNGA